MNNMEIRNIKVTLDKAKEWYHSGNSILRELALQAFTEREIKIPSYEEIRSLIPSYSLCDETDVLMRLSMYYRRSNDNIFLATGTKYFIGQIGYKEYRIMKHDTVRYPGIPYFKRLEDIREAAKIFSTHFKVDVRDI